MPLQKRFRADAGRNVGEWWLRQAVRDRVRDSVFGKLNQARRVDSGRVVEMYEWLSKGGV